MGKKAVISHRSRDRLRQREEYRRPTFMPTISVERPIIIDAEEAEDYQKKLDANLGKALKQKQRDHYKILDPNTLRLKLVEDVPVEPRHAREIVEELGANLLSLLDRAPQFMALPLGQVACFGEPNPQRLLRTRSVVGAQPSGWRGLNARYARYELGLRTPRTALGLLADEGAVCEQLLGPVVKTPYAAVVANSAGILSRELRDVEYAVRVSMLPETEWQDPVITLRTGRREGDVEVFNVRAPNVYDLAA